jgi:hypothetical protein
LSEMDSPNARGSSWALALMAVMGVRRSREELVSELERRLRLSSERDLCLRLLLGHQAGDQESLVDISQLVFSVAIRLSSWDRSGWRAYLNEETPSMVVGTRDWPNCTGKLGRHAVAEHARQVYGLLGCAGCIHNIEHVAAISVSVSVSVSVAVAIRCTRRVSNTASQGAAHNGPTDCPTSLPNAGLT